MTTYIDHVKQYAQIHGVPFKKAMKDASATYQKKAPARKAPARKAPAKAIRLYDINEMEWLAREEDERDKQFQDYRPPPLLPPRPVKKKKPPRPPRPASKAPMRLYDINKMEWLAREEDERDRQFQDYKPPPLLPPRPVKKQKPPRPPRPARPSKADDKLFKQLQNIKGPITEEMLLAMLIKAKPGRPPLKKLPPTAWNAKSFRTLRDKIIVG